MKKRHERIEMPRSPKRTRRQYPHGSSVGTMPIPLRIRHDVRSSFLEISCPLEAVDSHKARLERLAAQPGQHGVVAPDFVTHYYRRSRDPFLNLSELSDDEALGVMEDLMAERRDGKQHRLFGRKYLVMRRSTEAR